MSVCVSSVMLIHPVLGRADIPPSKSHTAPWLMALRQLKAGGGVE